MKSPSQIDGCTNGVVWGSRGCWGSDDMANVNWYLVRMWKSDCGWWWTGLAVEQGLRGLGDLSLVDCEVSCWSSVGPVLWKIGCPKQCNQQPRLSRLNVLSLQCNQHGPTRVLLPLLAHLLIDPMYLHLPRVAFWRRYRS